MLNLRKQFKKRVPYILCLPTFLILFAITVIPIGYLLYTSFCKWELEGFRPVFTGLANYELLFFRDVDFWHSVWITLEYLIIGLSLQFLLGFGMALIVNKPDLKFQGVFRTLIIVPMIMTPVVIGLFWRIMYNPTFGIINYTLQSIGLIRQPIPWLGQSSTALLSVIIVDTWQWTPFVFLLLSAGLKSLPVEPFEAAEIDGATRWQIFRYLTLPLLRYIILVTILFRGSDIFNTFDLIYVLTKGGPGTATQTLNMYGFLQMFTWLNLSYGATVIVSLLIIVGLFAAVFIKVLRIKVL